MRTVTPKNARLVPADAKRVFQGIMYDTYHWQQPMFDGSTKTFEMLKRVDTVKVIAVKDGRIVVLEEEQPSHGTYFAFPGGRHEEEPETEQQAAVRELHEETGFKFKNWKLLEIIQPNDEIEWFIYFFLATELESEDPPAPDGGGEKIHIRLLDLPELKRLGSQPNGTYLRREIFERVNTIDELLALPEYKAD